ncbi:unnamed protein product [Clonostachys rosea]|uniref:Uncharacterized protein n=1 Tax=Bionectria ochroleuca TaxID=29856 RepID=A0ABY6TRP5_BIOOC|nr:unnamed protein product [Clonostachys rosea]
MKPTFTISLPRPSPATISTATPTNIKKHWVRQYQQLIKLLKEESSPYPQKEILYMITASLDWDLHACLVGSNVDMTNPTEILTFINTD